MAVLTHKGRSADSGHYVAWVKQDDGQWVLVSFHPDPAASICAFECKPI